jgi:iron complex outermembrane receptor protein
MKKIILLVLVVLVAEKAFCQFNLYGKVSTSQAESLTGANVYLKNTYKGVFTDKEGNYKISFNKADSIHLVCTYLGFEKFDTTIFIDVSTELNIVLKPNTFNTQEFIVSATRVDAKTPMAQTTLSREQIQENNLGQDLPFLLDWTPSIVTTSDAGAGIGYSGIRIRGSDQTRINVTINGVPINDAEGQGVFWVNMPDLASSADDIQIQRGVGTSTNGPGAFGASINIKTNSVKAKPYGEISNTVGSFNTRKHSAQFGTGLIDNKFSFEGRLSQINSDGYIDRASSNLRSYYFSAAYIGAKTSINLVNFSGKEITYQAWAGVPKDSLKTNRTYNPYTYENEVDNYQQTHYQLHISHLLAENLSINTSLYYTKGMGYYEQFRNNATLASHNLLPVIVASDTIRRSDLIRRRWLDNDLYGMIYSLNYQNKKGLSLIFGGGYNHYEGDHFGEVIWAQYASNGNLGHRFYDNDAVKTDMNFYGKMNYQFTDKLFAFADLQYRTVSYKAKGIDNGVFPIDENVNFGFFNPKAGISYIPNAYNSFYGSFAVGNREPVRNDFIDAPQNKKPLHETLYNTEVGYQRSGKKYLAGLNLYHMYYNNQLVLTGAVNDVGAAIRQNIDKSYRAGAEITFAYNATQHIVWRANTTLSSNKILLFTEYVDNWDTGEQVQIQHQQSDIAFSPSVIAGSELIYHVFKNRSKQDLSFALLSKYVSRQYIDNTMSVERSLNPYFVNDLRLNYKLKKNLIREWDFSFMVRNLFSEMYESNAWVYRYYSGGEFGVIDGYFPQAGAHYLAGFTMRF